MAAIANAIERATGRRLTELPMSPPKVLAAIDAGGKIHDRPADAARKADTPLKAPNVRATDSLPGHGS
jgi:hypothetical protein